jgi:hypothetical protein
MEAGGKHPCERFDNLAMKDERLETADLRIQTLGPFQVWRQGEILTWPTQKSKALFQILLVEPGRLVSTDQILEYLWPDLPPRKAQNNLWVTVSQLRRVLQPEEYNGRMQDFDVWLHNLATKPLPGGVSAAALAAAMGAALVAKAVRISLRRQDVGEKDRTDLHAVLDLARYQQVLLSLAEADERAYRAVLASQAHKHGHPARDDAWYEATSVPVRDPGTLMTWRVLLPKIFSCGSRET